jgi:pimeloyl-ACP methyl ester carboxylesterase
MAEANRIALSTGVELDVWTAGDPANPPIIFLHGFPESHRTWRHQMAALSDRYFCVAPDQRGYAGSSKPEQVSAYAMPTLIADVFALADALGIGRFTLVGHDWGGALAWAVALKDQARVERLIQCNAAHPYVFQRTLMFDLPQREASQYIRTFRDRDVEGEVAEKGVDWFFSDRFENHLTAGEISAEDQAAYVAEWSHPGAIKGMLNWYRASPMQVPDMKAPCASTPFLDRPFPKLMMPTLVIWGMADEALLPCQLEGLDAHIDLLEIVEVPDAGHFVPWQSPDKVTAAMANFLTRYPPSRNPHSAPQS